MKSQQNIIELVTRPVECDENGSRVHHVQPLAVGRVVAKLKLGLASVNSSYCHLQQKNQVIENQILKALVC